MSEPTDKDRVLAQFERGRFHDLLDPPRAAHGARMKAYIGAKVIKAEPCTRQEFREEHSHLEPEPGYRVVYPDGYTSWSPKATFEEAYRELSANERALVAERQ